MKTRFLVYILMILALAVQSIAQESRFSGYVKDTNLKAISEIQVSAILDEDGTGKNISLKSTITSDADGKFEFKSLPPPQAKQIYYFVAYKQNVCFGWDEVDTKSRYKDNFLTIKAAGVSKAELFVVDQNYKAIPAAAVDFKCEIDLKGRGGIAYWIPSSVLLCVMGDKSPQVTDNQGKYVFTQLAEGLKMVPNVTKPGYFYMGAGGSPLMAVLTPSGKITGRVIDKDGVGIAGVSLQLYKYTKMPIKTKTDDKGNYSAEVMPDTYDVLVKDNSEIVASVLKNVTASVGIVTKAADITAGPGVIVSGDVIEADTKQPVPKASISVQRPDWPTNSGNSYTADDNGHFQFHATPGKIILSAGNRKNKGISDQVYEVPSNGLSVTLAIVGPERATGKVVDPNGKPVAAARVTINSLGTLPVQTDSLGSFAMNLDRDPVQKSGGVLPGKLLVEVEDPYTKRGFIGEFDRSQLLKGDLVIKVKPARPFTVTVKSDKNKPVAGAEVKYYRWYASSGVPHTAGKTNSSGKLIIDNLYAESSYAFEAAAAGFYPAEYIGEMVKIQTDTSQESITLTLETANSNQKGKVVNAAGKPIPRAVVATRWGPVTKTDEKGEFMLKGLPNRPIEVLCLGKTFTSKVGSAFMTIKIMQ